MNSGENALQRITEARDRVERATKDWSGGDLFRIAECRAMLVESLLELRELEQVLRQSVDASLGAGVFDSASAAAAISAVKIRAGLNALRSETARLERLVDSASAFIRGALLLTGAPTPGYTAGGRMQSNMASASSSGLQG
jgi:hypothetical protein